MKKYLLFIFTLSAALTGGLKAQSVEEEQCIGGNGDERVMDVKSTPDSGFLIVIETSSNNGDFSDNHGGIDIGLIKLDKYHQVQWKKCFGSYTDDHYHSATITGNILLTYSYYDTSETATIFGIYPIIINKSVYLNENGEVIWEIITHSFDATLKGIYTNCIATSDGGGFYATMKDSLFVCKLIKIDPLGNIEWEDSLNAYEFLSHFVLESTLKVFFYFKELQDSSIAVYANFRSENYDGFGNSPDSWSYWIQTIYSKTGVIISRDTFNMSTLYKSVHAEPLLQEDSILYSLTFKNYSNYDISSCYAFGISAYNITQHRISSEFEFGCLLEPADYLSERVREISLKKKSIYLSHTAYTDMGRLFLSRYSFSGNPEWKIQLDSADNYNFLYINNIIFTDNENSLIVFYNKDSVDYISKISTDGIVLYTKRFIKPPSGFQYYKWGITTEDQLYNFIPYWTNYFYNIENLVNNLFYIQDDKLYTYFIYQNSNNNTQFFQAIQITNLQNGNTSLVYENYSYLKNYTLFKLLRPLPDNRLLVLYDLNGVHKCQLGGFDVVLSKVDIMTRVNSHPEIPNNLIIYPNPGNGQFNFHTGMTYGHSYIQLYDVSGKKVWEQIIRNSDTVLDAGNLEAGTYIVRLMDGEQNLYGKLIIQH